MSESLAYHLQSLAAGQVIQQSGDAEIPVSAPFTEDSRDVRPGGVFVARSGLIVDGHNFIDRAIDAGAVAIIGERPRELSVPYVQVRDSHLAIGRLAASYYGFPSRKLTVIGITGTNGKTTTTHLLHSILKRWTGGKAGYISTIGADFGQHSADTGLHVTTPQAADIQRYLAEMVEAGLTHVILEMTSHGLVQGRLSGVDIDMGIVTNVTHEHLDFHGSFDAYLDAKGILFDMLSQSYRKTEQPKISVLNADDVSYAKYAKKQADIVHAYGIEGRDVEVTYAPDGTTVVIDGIRFHLKLVGEFNVYNALAAYTAAHSLGVDDEAIQSGLEAVDGVSGRMERIDEGQDFLALVDFAHTPDALEKVLKAARLMLPDGNRLITVFGSAGLRDVEKRRMMAEVSARLADMTVLTAEDPRTESLDQILQMMADGCIAQGGKEGETFIRIPDRGEALYRACQLAQTGDIVMACGKGHEQSMCFGEIEYPWDDRDALRAALRGNPLQTLPTATEGA